MAEENLEKNASIEVLPAVIEPEKKQASGSDAGIIKQEVLDLTGEKLPGEELTVVDNAQSVDLTAKNEKQATHEAGLSQFPHIVIDIVPKDGLEVIKDAEVHKILEPNEIDPSSAVDKEFIRDYKDNPQENPKPPENADEIFSLEEFTIEDKPKGPSFGEKFLKILKTGRELGKSFLENSQIITRDLARKGKPKIEGALNKARDVAEEAGHIAGGLAIKGGAILKEKAGDVANFLKESGIALKAEIGSNLESAISLAADAFEKISKSDVVAGAVDRISIFKSSMAEAWVGSRVDEFNQFIKQEEAKVQVIKESLKSREADLANLQQISKDVGFEVSDSAKKKLEEDIAKKSAELKAENDRIETMKAENSFYDIRRTGYLAKIEESKRNIADRIKAKIDINSKHSQELQTSLDELSSNKKRVGGELEKLTTHFRELDKITRETNSSGARRSAVSLMRQIGPKINELEEELISCNKDEGKILKRKAKIDAKLEKNDEQLGDLGVSPREKNKLEKAPSSGPIKLNDESIIPTPTSSLEQEERPVYFEDSLDEGGEVSTLKQEKQETEAKFSLDEFLNIWNKDFPELSLVRGSFSSTSKTKRDKSSMRHVIFNLINNQHPGSNIKVVKICIDDIYKNK